MAAAMEVDSSRGLRAAEEVGDVWRRAVLDVVQENRGSLVGRKCVERVEEVRVERLRHLAWPSSLPPCKPCRGLPSDAASIVKGEVDGDPPHPCSRPSKAPMRSQCLRERIIASCARSSAV